MTMNKMTNNKCALIMAVISLMPLSLEVDMCEFNKIFSSLKQHNNVHIENKDPIYPSVGPDSFTISGATSYLTST